MRGVSRSKVREPPLYLLEDLELVTSSLLHRAVLPHVGILRQGDLVVFADNRELGKIPVMFPLCLLVDDEGGLHTIERLQVVMDLIVLVGKPDFMLYNIVPPAAKPT